MDDVAFLLVRGGEAFAVRGEETEADRVFADDDGGRADPADDIGFLFFTGRSGMSTGLRYDFFCRHTAVDGFGDTEDMVRPLTCDGVFFSGGAVFLPLEDEGLLDVVQRLCCDGGVVVDIIVEDVFIGLTDTDGDVQVAVDMGGETARVGVVLM